MKKLLFLCTGNYYRSRFAEIYFRHLALRSPCEWTVDSRGLRISPRNPGPISKWTRSECEKLGLVFDPLRLPIAVTANEIQSAQLTIAVKESEHRPMMQANFPDFEDRIRYWEIHDLDCATPDETLLTLREHVNLLFQTLSS